MSSKPCFNTLFCRNDTTQTGHDLGDANSRTGAMGSERNLSPPAICILRAIMHSAFLWCSCHHHDCIGDLARIVKPFVHPQYLPEFFWKHLEHDIKQLSITTGRNEDDATLLIHIVLKEILTKTPPTGNFGNSFNCYNAVFVFPIFYSKQYDNIKVNKIWQLLYQVSSLAYFTFIYIFKMEQSPL